MGSRIVMAENRRILLLKRNDQADSIDEVAWSFFALERFKS